MIDRIFRTLELRTFFYIFSFLFRFVLDISYVTFQYPIYSYSGFHLNFSLQNYLISWLFTILVVFITPNLLNKASDYFLATFCFSLLIPLFSLYAFNDELSVFPVIITLCSYIWLVVTLNIRLQRKSLKLPFIKNGQKIFQIICLFMIGYLIVWYIVSGAISNFNLDPTKVYQFRKTNSNLTNIGVLTYLNTWVYKVFNLSLLAYALLKKKKTLFISLILVQIFFYGVSAHKAVLFTPLIIISIYFYFTRTKSLATIPLAFTLITATCLGIFHYNGDVVPAALSINRVFFIPNYLTFVYFEFFSANSFSYWSDSFNFLLQPIYPEGIPNTVGSYLGTDEFANNGFISSGYAQAGVLGVMFYVFLTTFILKLINQLSEDIGALWFALCIVITPLRSLVISADLMTTLLTHGLILSIFMLILLRRPNFKL